jgi:hypothetical protein
MTGGLAHPFNLSYTEARRVAQAFDLAGTINIVVAPSFAHFAKGGNLKRMRDRVGERTKIVSAASLPALAKKRKDWAPSAKMAHTGIIKMWATPGRLPQFVNLCRSHASTVFVGSTASSSTCSLMIFPDLSMRKVARRAVSMGTP